MKIIFFFLFSTNVLLEKPQNVYSVFFSFFGFSFLPICGRQFGGGGVECGAKTNGLGRWHRYIRVIEVDRCLFVNPLKLTTIRRVFLFEWNQKKKMNGECFDSQRKSFDSRRRTPPNTKL
jgi:hypothetical protein